MTPPWPSARGFGRPAVAHHRQMVQAARSEAEYTPRAAGCPDLPKNGNQTVGVARPALMNYSWIMKTFFASVGSGCGGKDDPGALRVRESEGFGGSE